MAVDVAILPRSRYRKVSSGIFPLVVIFAGRGAWVDLEKFRSRFG